MGKTGKATVDTATATRATSGTAKRTTTPRKSATSASTPPAGEQPKATARAPKAATSDSSVGEQEQSATARAEEVFDDAGQRVGQFALIAGQYLRQFTARAREEAEDIWVEAQNVRGKKP